MNANLSDKLRELKQEQSSLLNELEDAKHDKNTVQAKLVCRCRCIEARV